MLDFWIVVIGALAAGSCALLGNYLVLRQMSMMGDAISHAVLPGLAVAFLLTGSRTSVPMFIGAALVGVLTAFLTEWISHLGKVERGASMGIVFTTLFALGLVLIVQAADFVDLDPACVLYGSLELTPLDVIWEVAWLGLLWEVPRAAVVLLAVFLCNCGFVILCYKELRLSSFDPGLATTLGFSARRMHYLLMAFVAVTTVAAFEVVGSILVIAMMIVPPATAYLLTRRLGTMLLLSVCLGVVAALAGHWAAVEVPGWFGYPETSTSGSMALMTGIFFLTALAWIRWQGRRKKFRTKPVFLPSKEP